MKNPPTTHPGEIVLEEFLKPMGIYIIIASCVLLGFDLCLADSLNLTKNEQKWLDSHPKITIGILKNSLPQSMVNKDGIAVGLVPDLIRILNKKLSGRLDIIPGEWQDIFKDAKNHKIDLLTSITPTKKRGKYFNFTCPYILYPHVIIAKKTGPHFGNFNALNGQFVACVSSNFINSYIRKHYPEIKIKEYGGPLEALSALKQGEVKAYIGSGLVSKYLLSKNNFTSLNVHSKSNETAENNTIGVRKDWPELTSILDKTLASIPEEELKLILEKWENAGNKKNYIKLTQEEAIYLKKNAPIKVQGLDAFPPFNFVQNGEPAGYSVDYIKLLGKYIGVETVFTKNKSWGETITMFKEGKIDILPNIAVNEERKKFIDFTTFNHIEYNTGIAIRKGEKIRSASDFKNKTIAVINKSFIHASVKKILPNQTLLLVPSSSIAVEAVALGKADVVIGSIPTLNYFIQKNWLSNITTAHIGNIDLEKKTALPMGVKKGNRLLLSILEKANASLPHNEVVNLKKKWMNIRSLDQNKISFNDEEIRYLNSKKNITFCVNPHWMPFEKIEDNIHLGMTSEYFPLFQNKLPIPLTLVQTKNIEESIQYLKQKKCDILSVRMDNGDKQGPFNYSIPYIKAPFVIATKINTPFLNDMAGITDKKIGIVKDLGYANLFKMQNPQLQLIFVSSIKEGLEKVSGAELFGFIGTLPAVAHQIQENFVGDVKVGGKFEQDRYFSMAFRPDDPLLITIFNKLIKTISDQEHKQINKNWISFNIQNSINYTKLLYVACFFTAIVLIVLYKNRSINLMNNKLTTAHTEIKSQQGMVDKYVLIVEADIKGVITRANEAYCKSMGYTQEELVGETHLSQHHPDLSDGLFTQILEMGNGNKAWSGVIKTHTKNQKKKWFNVYINPVVKDQCTIGYRAICEDITDKKRIEQLSITDKLTGINNRLKIDEIILSQLEVNKRYQTDFSIILMDIDNFKNINDTYGHDTGDKILTKLAKILKDNIRVTDTIGRWGGEEFIVICPNTIADDAFILAEHLRCFIEKNQFEDVGKVTISLGVSELINNDTQETLFKKADTALYKAKNTGKNKTVKM